MSATLFFFAIKADVAEGISRMLAEMGHRNVGSFGRSPDCEAALHRLAPFESGEPQPF